MSGDHAVRLSDAERAAAAADLGEHYAQGRLTVEEHSERVDAVWAAKTRGELPPLFADLPSPYAAVAAPPPTPSRGPLGPPRYWASGLRPAYRRLPAPIVVVLGFLLVVAVLTHLPVILLGLGVWWFVASRHRRHGWH